MDDPINVAYIPSSSLHDVPYSTSSHSLAAPTTPLYNSTNSPIHSNGDAGVTGKTGKAGVSERDFWSSKMRLPTPFPQRKEGWLSSDEDSAADESVDKSAGNTSVVTAKEDVGQEGVPSA